LTKLQRVTLKWELIFEKQCRVNRLWRRHHPTFIRLESWHNTGVWWTDISHSAYSCNKIE